MPFETLETETKDNMQPMASLSYLRHVRKDKEQNRGRIKPRLTVMLPTAVCISKKERFILQVGTGQDAGKVRVVGVDGKKGCKATDFKSYVRLNFGHVPALGDDIFDGERVPITRVNDDTYDLLTGELFADAALAALRRKTKVAA